MSDGENHDGRGYIVLRATTDHDGHPAWTELTELDARNAHVANRTAAERHLDPQDLEDGVELHAISSRSWRSGASRVKTEHKTRIVTS